MNDLLIQKAAGSRLYSSDGKVFIDLSSINSHNLIGHNIKELNDGIACQLTKSNFSSIISLEHEPAQLLTDKLMRHIPQSSDKALEFHSSECLAMEQAIMTVYRYWHAQHQPKRKTIISFAHGYHGESMSCVNFNASFKNHNHFDDFLIPTEHIPYPCTWFQDKDADVKESLSLSRLNEFLSDQHLNCAAIVIEPLLQARNGMQACRPGFLNKVIEIIQDYGLLIVSDERNLSPMRSGQFFVSQYLSRCPDILVSGSAMTNHLCPFGLTITRDQIMAQIQSNVLLEPAGSLNQFACHAANQTIAIIDEQITGEHIHALQSVHMSRLHKLNKQPIIKNVRYLGSIGAFEVICEDRSQQQKLLDWFHKRCLEYGLLLEPFHKNICITPPLCLSTDDLHSAYDTIENIVETLPLKYITSCLDV